MDDVVELTGKSGEKYVFFTTFYSSAFQARPGVYVLAKALGGNRYSFCYIGETADMSVRPFAPHRVDCFKSFGVDRIFHLEEVSAEKRTRMVQDLLQAFQPICNTQ